MAPLISVCVPTFNASKYLRECLDSVLAQTFTDFELLIVDNHSTDETLSIVKEYAERDHRVRIIRNKYNIGAVRNFNRCLEVARGEWIKFVFSDDLIAPRCLERMLAESKPDSSIICCRRDILFEPGTSLEVQKYYQQLLTIEELFHNSTKISANNFCEAVLDNRGQNFIGEPTAVLLHQKVLRKFGKFNPHLLVTCDIEFWTRIAIHAGMIYVPETLATFRVHDSSISANVRESRFYRLYRQSLDSLILNYNFAFHPSYVPLRAMGKCHYPKIDFEESVLNLALRLKAVAERAAADPINPDASLLNEWEQVVSHHPNLSKLSKIKWKIKWKKLLQNPLGTGRRFIRNKMSILSGC